MIRPPTRSTLTYTRFPYTPLCRSVEPCVVPQQRVQRGSGVDARGEGVQPQPGKLVALPRRGEIGQQQDEIDLVRRDFRSEEHTSELQSLMRLSYAVFCLQKTKQKT